MIPLGKSLEMSMSQHFAYINSYIHTFICSVSISIWCFKNEQIYWNLAKLFNKATSFSCHKKKNTIVPDNSNSREHLPQFGSWDLKKRYIVSSTWNANKLQGQRNGGWAMKLLPNDGLSISNYPSWNPDTFGAIIGLRARFRRTLCGSI